MRSDKWKVLLQYNVPKSVLAEILIRSTFSIPWFVITDSRDVEEIAKFNYNNCDIWILDSWHFVKCRNQGTLQGLLHLKPLLILPTLTKATRQLFPRFDELTRWVKSHQVQIHNNDYFWVIPSQKTNHVVLINSEGTPIFTSDSSNDDEALPDSSGRYIHKPTQSEDSGHNPLNTFLNTTAEIKTYVKNHRELIKYVGGFSYRLRVLNGSLYLEGGEHIIAPALSSNSLPLAVVESGLLREANRPALLLSSEARKIALLTPTIPGVAVGRIVTAKSDKIDDGSPFIFIHTPESIRIQLPGENVQGIITYERGVTSHAAIFANQRNIPCVQGDIHELPNGRITLNGIELPLGEWISVNYDGGVYIGRHVIRQSFSRHGADMIYDTATAQKIYVNINSVADLSALSQFGSPGVGLYRSEQIFAANPELINLLGKYISGRSVSQTQEILKEKHYHAYEEILAYKKTPGITIRAFDPSLAEFGSIFDSADFAAMFQEANPAMGRRGARLYLAYPRYLALQVEALGLAIKNVYPDGNFDTKIAFIIPTVSSTFDMIGLKGVINSTLRRFNLGLEQKVLVGSMIETPNALRGIEQIAAVVDIISIGTNDLEQFNMAMSRDDSSKVFTPYPGLLTKWALNTPSPERVSWTLTQDIVRALKRARAANTNVVIGYCGSHTEPRLISALLPHVDYFSVSAGEYPTVMAWAHLFFQSI